MTGAACFGASQVAAEEADLLAHEGDWVMMSARRENGWVVVVMLLVGVGLMFAAGRVASWWPWKAAPRGDRWVTVRMPDGEVQRLRLIEVTRDGNYVVGP